MTEMLLLCDLVPIFAVLLLCPLHMVSGL
jgi:hypothetical protein